MQGTYELQVFTSEDESECVVFVLAEKAGKWRGAVVEMLCRMFIMEDGEVAENTFRFRIPSTLTIFGDISMDINGRVEGDLISGEFITAMGNLPYSGKRISDSVFPVG